MVLTARIDSSFTAKALKIVSERGLIDPRQRVSRFNSESLFSKVIRSMLKR